MNGPPGVLAGKYQILTEKQARHNRASELMTLHNEFAGESISGDARKRARVAQEK